MINQEIDKLELAALRMVAAAAVDYVESLNGDTAMGVLMSQDFLKHVVEQYVKFKEGKSPLERRIEACLHNLDERAAAVVERGGDAEC